MGKIDDVTRDFFSDNERFSDICNYLMYRGQQVIMGEDLSELDAMELLGQKDGSYTKRQRDLLRRAVIRQTDDTVIVIIGIENQSLTHYGMPVKNMLYDAIRYAKQVEVLSARNKGKLKGGKEFLSGLTKDDRIKPIITLTVYWGAESWDGPHTLYDMLDITDEELLPYINNYRINLISPIGMKDFSKFHTDVKEVFELVSVSGDKKALRKLVKTHEEYHRMNRTAAIVIAGVLNIKIKNKEEREINMCKAMEDMLYDERCEGIRMGEKRGEKRGEKQGAKKQAEVCARNLLELRVNTVEQIAKATGLSIARVRKLQKER